MNTYRLFSPLRLGGGELSNRIVMAPLTRCRAIGNLPNKLMSQYYEQRSAAGLLITEGTSPSPDGLGYARMPGIFNRDQMQGWRQVTSAVHQTGSKIFVQLMHTGRISHPLNMPEGAEVIAPSPIKAAGQIWTDTNKLQDYVVPKAMNAEDILRVKSEYVAAAKNAIQAGFDGVELHGANGYLLEQFLSPISNVRIDKYGGTVENRCRFVLEVVAQVADGVGKEKTGIRLSPYGTASDMSIYPEIDATYNYLSEELNKIGIVYIHIADHSAMGAPEVPLQIKNTIRQNFKNLIILCGGFDKESAEEAIGNGLADLIAFGRPFINNPDLVERFANNWALSERLYMDLFYTADEKGYTDYPAYAG